MNVLVPFEVQPVSERAVRATLELFGSDRDVHVIAVHVSDREEDPSRIAAREIEAMGERRGISVEAEIRILDGSPPSKDTVRESIVEIVDSREIDLVVLGYEPKSLVDRALRSDTTERVLEGHDVPVLLVP